MKWTEQQQTAIDARNASFIVSAAAGSGKTAVLTERLVELLADPESGVRADRIVAVTFTNAAASDLKKKLDRRIRQIISERTDTAHLLHQQVLLQSAKISTINAFCFELLRDNISDQGITSGFGILDENDEAVIKAKAADELMDLYSRERYDKISFLYDKFCINSHQALIDTIFSCDRFLSSTAAGEKWLDYVVGEYKKPFHESVYYDSLFADVTEKLETALRLAEQNKQDVKNIFPDMTIPQAEKMKIQSEEDYLKVDGLLGIALNRNFPDDETAEKAMKFASVVSWKQKIVFNEAMCEIYRKRREKIKKIIQKVLPSFVSAQRDFEESGKVAEILAEAVKEYRRIVWRCKCEKNAITFDDGERLLLDLLSGYDENGNITQSETALKISDTYDVILVDEYQDSNNKQDLIFKLLSKGFKHDKNGKAMYGTNAFVVGDIKQCIYRFRLANPRNFKEVLESSEPYSRESTCENKSILLNRNFRSSQEVINFVNFFFGKLMTEKCGEIKYTDSEKLYYGAAQYGEKTESRRLTHITFFEENDKQSGEYEKFEAEITADKIAEMLDAGVMVTERDGTERPCRCEDFTILVRTKAAVRIYAEALQKRGIETKGSEEKGYLKSREIAILTDLLRVIANPLKDVPLAAVMLSPMYPFTVSDIAVLKSKNRNLNLFSLVRMAAEHKLNGISEELSARCGDFLVSVDEFRLNSVTMTIAELISSIYDTTDFVSVMQQYTDGEKKRANLRLLIQYAQNYEAASAADRSGGLSGFVAHLDRVIENGDYEQGKVSASSSNQVVVQTLHKSKGLEYPFVFIAELGYEFQFDSDRVMCEDDGRMGFILCDKQYLRRYRTFQQVVLMSEKRSETLSEELRLMYVALTRAKQQLFINLNCGEAEKKRISELMNECVVNGSCIDKLAENAVTFADWFWLVLMMHGDFVGIADCTGIPCGQFGFPSAETDEKLFDYEFCSEIKKSGFEITDNHPANPDEALVAELKKRFAMPYDRKLSQTPSKLSVTQIAKKFSVEKELGGKLRRPSFISDGTRLTGSERGTAVHTFFQYCDFENSETDAESEVNILVTKGFLTKAQAESIDISKVKAFFASDLYGRIKKSAYTEREKKFTVAAAELKIDDSVFERLKESDGMIKGIIDLVYEENDGLVIVDYKSDRGANENNLIEHYRKQLEIYRAALELTTGKTVKKTVLYSIELMKEIEVV